MTNRGPADSAPPPHHQATADPLKESRTAHSEAHPAMEHQFDDAKTRGLVLRRARYVELPPSDYLVWEMAVLHERVSRGEQIRVVVGQGQSGFQAPPPVGFPNLSFSRPSGSMN
ncbi:DUF6879 family protein [Streptomyces sp. NPDC056244]|uniref:DUF6879 family protein n=1 Tax=Streptomyces sp. NPDC056244 TaxID=3345762 RepID=UPI0035D87335